MIISHENKVVYVGVPHTGSTFIHCYLSRFDDLVVDCDNLKHATCLQSLVFNTKGYEFILFVRNHFEYFASEWSLMDRVSDKSLAYIETFRDEQWKNKCIEFKKEKPCFDSFLQKTLSCRDSNSSLFDFYLSDRTHNTILKYENFDESCQLLFKRLGKTYPVGEPKINKSANKPLIKDKHKNLIERVYGKEMEKFGYLRSQNV